MAPTFEKLRPVYSELLATVEIRPNWERAAENVARKAIANKARYQKISDACNGVPWQLIAAIHNLEGSSNFSTHLHNGDSLRARTHHVPAGRPAHGSPPFTFEESAVDALEMKGLQNIENWSPEMICYQAERYNGWGYRMYHPNTLSPYLWSGTNHYSRGKYVSDGEWSSSEVSEQIGIIPIIKKIDELDIDHKALVEENSRKVKIIKSVQRGIVATGMSWFTADTLNIIPDYLAKIQGFMGDNKLMCIIAVAFVFFGIIEVLKHMTIQDAVSGRYVPSGADEKIEVTHVPPVKAEENVDNNTTNSGGNNSNSSDVSNTTVDTSTVRTVVNS